MGRLEPQSRSQRERITMQDIDEFGATVDCPGCNAIKDCEPAQANSDRCRVRIEECLRITPQGAERLDRKSEVVHEALTEDLQRGYQRKERDSRVTTAASASSSAAGIGQQHVKRSSIDVEAEAPAEVPMEIDADKLRRVALRDGRKHQTQNCRETFSGGNSAKQFRSDSHHSRRN